MVKELTEMECRNIFGGRPIYIIHKNGTFEIMKVRIFYK